MDNVIKVDFTKTRKIKELTDKTQESQLDKVRVALEKINSVVAAKRRVLQQILDK
jgi:hypothetical protein